MTRSASALEPGYALPMVKRDLADPSFEPSDEDFAELTTRAFAGVAADNARNLERLCAEIEAERERVLRALAARRAAPSAP